MGNDRNNKPVSIVEAMEALDDEGVDMGDLIRTFDLLGEAFGPTRREATLAGCRCWLRSAGKSVEVIEETMDDIRRRNADLEIQFSELKGELAAVVSNLLDLEMELWEADALIGAPTRDVAER